MPPHRIYLRGPWDCEPLAYSADASAVALPSAKRTQLPASWTEVFGEFRGLARFRRKFHRPTNLAPDERVILVFEGVGGMGRVAVNGHDVGMLISRETPQRFDITPHLVGNDELVVELEFVSQDQSARGGMYGPVVLEMTRFLAENMLG